MRLPNFTKRIIKLYSIKWQVPEEKLTELVKLFYQTKSASGYWCAIFKTMGFVVERHRMKRFIKKISGKRLNNYKKAR